MSCPWGTCAVSASHASTAPRTATPSRCRHRSSGWGTQGSPGRRPLSQQRPWTPGFPSRAATAARRRSCRVPGPPTSAPRTPPHLPRQHPPPSLAQPRHAPGCRKPLNGHPDADLPPVRHPPLPRLAARPSRHPLWQCASRPLAPALQEAKPRYSYLTMQTAIRRADSFVGAPHAVIIHHASMLPSRMGVLGGEPPARRDPAHASPACAALGRFTRGMSVGASGSLTPTEPRTDTCGGTRQATRVRGSQVALQVAAVSGALRAARTACV